MSINVKVEYILEKPNLTKASDNSFCQGQVRIFFDQQQQCEVIDIGNIMIE